MRDRRVTRSFDALVVGLHFRMTNVTLQKLKDEVESYPLNVFLEREPRNLHDRNALKVVVRDSESDFNGVHIGYIARSMAEILADRIDTNKVTVKEAYLLSIDTQEGDGDLRIKVKMPLKG